MANKLPEKDKPDFSMLDNKRVRDWKEFVNAMIGCYSEFPDKVEMLKEVWKDLSNECVSRLSDDCCKEQEVVSRKHFRRLKAKNS